MTTEQHHAPWRARLGFGVGGFGVALVYATIGVLLLYFYTRVLGMRSDQAGTILAIGALSDAILDPIVGWLAGRTDTRWGRYRPYLLFGGIPLSFALVAVFLDPGLDGQSLFLYCLVTLTIFRAAFQFIYMPYTSLVVVLTRDADERSDIEGWRAWFIAAGQLIVSFGALSAIDWLGAGDDRRGFLLLAVVFATMTAASFMFTGIVTREIRSGGHARDVSDPRRIAQLLWKNDQFRIVVVATLACQTGYAVLLSGALPFVEQAFGHRELSRWPLTALTASALLASFLWPAVSRRYGKRATWISGASLAVVALCATYFFALSSIWLLVAGFFVIGIAAQAVLIMQFAAAADSLDYGHWKLGERTEAVGFAMMTLASKVSMAIGNGLLGWCYHYVGYPDAPDGKASMLDGMLLVYLGLPIAAYLIAIYFLRGYMLTADMHRQLIVELDARHAAAPAE